MMNFQVKTILALSTAASALAVAMPARADDQAADSGDIVVTARRVEERLQDVPISISVFNQQQITDRNIVSGNDLATYTPSLSTNQRYGPDTSSFAIRGFTQEANTAPSVGVYFADVVTPRSLGGTSAGSNLAIGAFMDLQNTQILKGPQGTLFGRNTTGGAILLVPQRPTDQFEGYLEGSVGDYRMRRAQAVVNIPLSDTLKIRLGGDRQIRDGYFHNRSGIGPKDLNDTDYYYFRVGILANITPDFENYTVFHYSNSDTNGFGTRLVTCARTLAERLPLGAGIFTAPSACDQLDRQTARGDGKFDVESPIRDPFFKLKQYQAINTSTWTASDNLTVKNIISFSRFTSDLSYNLNGESFVTAPTGLPLPVPVAIGLPYPTTSLYKIPGAHGADQTTFTEELQFQGVALDGALDWQAGGYLEISRAPHYNEGYASIFNSCPNDQPDDSCTNPYGFGTLSNFRAKNRFDNKAIYAQATYKFTDKLSLTAGIRYTWDKQKAQDEATRTYFPVIAGFGTPVLRCNNNLVFPDPANGTIGMAVTDASQCHRNISSKSDKPTWLINLDYKPVDDVMLYAKWARGYRAAGVNSSNVGLEAWGPEKLENYEIGLKASFTGAIRGFFNIAGFYNDFTDQQVVATLIEKSTNVAKGPTILNAGSSTIKGVEIDAGVTPFTGLNLTLGYAYLDTKLKKLAIPSSTLFILQPLAIEGDPLTLTPKNRVTLSANYKLPLPESVGAISIGATFTHTDKQLISRNTLPQYQYLPATDLLNLNINWNKVAGSQFDAAFFMTNVTNELITTVTSSTYSTLGFESLQYGAPRMYGFRLRFNF